MEIGPRSVPPTCPAFQYEMDHAVDVTKLTFEVSTFNEEIGERTTPEEGIDDVTLAWGSFRQPGGGSPPEDLHTRSIDVDRDSIEEQEIKEIAADPYLTERLRHALLRRMTHCHGVVTDEDGDPTCWALSADGLAEAISEVRNQEEREE